MNKPLGIGVAGGSASGKTTFCKNLEDKLSGQYRVNRIQLDTYFHKPLPKLISPLTQETADDWNHPDSIDYKKPIELIKSLQAENLCDIIIAEGVHLFCYDEMRPLFDLKIFIELDAETRMHRRVKRNTNNFASSDGFYGTDFQFGYYLNFARFREEKYILPTKVYADILLNGNKLDGVAFDILLAWIKEKRTN